MDIMKNKLPLTNIDKWNTSKYKTSYHIEYKNNMMELFLFAAPTELFHYYGEYINDDTFLEEAIEIIYIYHE